MFGTTVAITYGFLQLMSLSLATAATFSKELTGTVLNKIIRKEVQAQVNTCMEGTQRTCRVGVGEQYWEGWAEHTGSGAKTWWVKLATTPVCDLGKFGFGVMVAWAILSFSLIVAYATKPRHKQLMLYKGLFGAGVGLYAIIFVLSVIMNRELWIRALLFFAMQAGLLSMLWAMVQVMEAND
jgi:hypothetical protein